MLLKSSAPHRAENLPVAVKHTIKVVLVSRGKSEDQAAKASDNNAAAGLAFTQSKVDGYIASGKPAEEAYDRAIDDLSAWAQRLI